MSLDDDYFQNKYELYNSLDDLIRRHLFQADTLKQRQFIYASLLSLMPQSYRLSHGWYEDESQHDFYQLWERASSHPSPDTLHALKIDLDELDSDVLDIGLCHNLLVWLAKGVELHIHTEDAEQLDSQGYRACSLYQDFRQLLSATRRLLESQCNNAAPSQQQSQRSDDILGKRSFLSIVQLLSFCNHFYNRYPHSMSELIVDQLAYHLLGYIDPPSYDQFVDKETSRPDLKAIINELTSDVFEQYNQTLISITFLHCLNTGEQLHPHNPFIKCYQLFTQLQQGLIAPDAVKDALQDAQLDQSYCQIPQFLIEYINNNLQMHASLGVLYRYFNDISQANELINGLSNQKAHSSLSTAVQGIDQILKLFSESLDLYKRLNMYRDVRYVIQYQLIMEGIDRLVVFYDNHRPWSQQNMILKINEGLLTRLDNDLCTVGHGEVDSLQSIDQAHSCSDFSQIILSKMLGLVAMDEPEFNQWVHFVTESMNQMDSAYDSSRCLERIAQHASQLEPVNTAKISAMLDSMQVGKIGLIESLKCFLDRLSEYFRPGSVRSQPELFQKITVVHRACNQLSLMLGQSFEPLSKRASYVKQRKLYLMSQYCYQTSKILGQETTIYDVFANQLLVNVKSEASNSDHQRIEQCYKSIHDIANDQFDRDADIVQNPDYSGMVHALAIYKLSIGYVLFLVKRNYFHSKKQFSNVEQLQTEAKTNFHQLDTIFSNIGFDQDELSPGGQYLLMSKAGQQAVIMLLTANLIGPQRLMSDRKVRGAMTHLMRYSVDQELEKALGYLYAQYSDDNPFDNTLVDLEQQIKQDRQLSPNELSDLVSDIAQNLVSDQQDVPYYLSQLVNYWITLKSAYYVIEKMPYSQINTLLSQLIIIKQGGASLSSLPLYKDTLLMLLGNVRTLHSIQARLSLDLSLDTVDRFMPETVKLVQDIACELPFCVDNNKELSSSLPSQYIEHWLQDTDNRLAYIMYQYSNQNSDALANTVWPLINYQIKPLVVIQFKSKSAIDIFEFIDSLNSSTRNAWQIIQSCVNPSQEAKSFDDNIVSFISQKLPCTSRYLIDVLQNAWLKIFDRLDCIKEGWQDNDLYQVVQVYNTTDHLARQLGSPLKTVNPELARRAYGYQPNLPDGFEEDKNTHTSQSPSSKRKRKRHPKNKQSQPHTAPYTNTNTNTHTHTHTDTSKDVTVTNTHTDTNPNTNTNTHTHTHTDTNTNTPTPYIEYQLDDLLRNKLYDLLSQDQLNILSGRLQSISRSNQQLTQTDWQKLSAQQHLLLDTYQRVCDCLLSAIQVKQYYQQGIDQLSDAMTDLHDRWQALVHCLQHLWDDRDQLARDHLIHSQVGQSIVTFVLFVDAFHNVDDLNDELRYSLSRALWDHSSSDPLKAVVAYLHPEVDNRQEVADDLLCFEQYISHGSDCQLTRLPDVLQKALIKHDDAVPEYLRHLVNNQLLTQAVTVIMTHFPHKQDSCSLLGQVAKVDQDYYKRNTAKPNTNYISASIDYWIRQITDSTTMNLWHDPIYIQSAFKASQIYILRDYYTHNRWNNTKTFISQAKLLLKKLDERFAILIQAEAVKDDKLYALKPIQDEVSLLLKNQINPLLTVLHFKLPNIWRLMNRLSSLINQDKSQQVFQSLSPQDYPLPPKCKVQEFADTLPWMAHDWCKHLNKLISDLYHACPASQIKSIEQVTVRRDLLKHLQAVANLLASQDHLIDQLVADYERRYDVLQREPSLTVNGHGFFNAAPARLTIKREQLPDAVWRLAKDVQNFASEQGFQDARLVLGGDAPLALIWGYHYTSINDFDLLWMGEGMNKQYLEHLGDYLKLCACKRGDSHSETQDNEPYQIFLPNGADHPVLTIAAQIGNEAKIVFDISPLELSQGESFDDALRRNRRHCDIKLAALVVDLTQGNANENELVVIDYVGAYEDICHRQLSMIDNTPEHINHQLSEDPGRLIRLVKKTLAYMNENLRLSSELACNLDAVATPEFWQAVFQNQRARGRICTQLDKLFDSFAVESIMGCLMANSSLGMLPRLAGVPLQPDQQQQCQALWTSYIKQVDHEDGYQKRLYLFHCLAALFFVNNPYADSNQDYLFKQVKPDHREHFDIIRNLSIAAFDVDPENALHGQLHQLVQQTYTIASVYPYAMLLYQSDVYEGPSLVPEDMSSDYSYNT